MTPAPGNDHNLLAAVTVASLILLAVLVAGGFILASPRFGTGIAAGGLIALGNTLWLRRTIEQAMGMEARQAGRFAVVRYLLRLILLAGVLYLLIVKAGIDIIGLVLGLSVIVIVIFGFSLYRVARFGG